MGSEMCIRDRFLTDFALNFVTFFYKFRTDFPKHRFCENERFVSTRASKSRVDAYRKRLKINWKTRSEFDLIFNAFFDGFGLRFGVQIECMAVNSDPSFPMNGAAGTWDVHKSDFGIHDGILLLPKPLPRPSKSDCGAPKTLPRATLASKMKPFYSLRFSREPPKSDFGNIWLPRQPLRARKDTGRRHRPLGLSNMLFSNF